MFAAFSLVALVAVVAAEQCADRHPNCPSWKANGFCTQALYSQMRSTCSVSCGLCTPGGSTGGGSTCADKNVADCIKWVTRGFCQNAMYTDAQKKSYCAASCGYC